MAKRIIILEQVDARQYRYALWADVPAARQASYAAKAKPTVYVMATQAEKDAITNGQIAERVDVLQATTVAEAKQMLIDLWNAWQAEVTAANVWSRYGTYWDGTSWTAGGVA